MACAKVCPHATAPYLNHGQPQNQYLSFSVIVEYLWSLCQDPFNLCEVFARLCENLLQANLNKCKFGKPHVKYLGHVIESVEPHSDIDKVAHIRNWAPPVNIKGL